MHFLIAGATGRQGSSVVGALLAHPTIKVEPSQIYALTRDVSGSSAQGLATKHAGINIITGDLASPAAIFAQIDAQNTGVYLAQAHGPTELTEAKAFIDEAAAQKVPYFVYSSVDRGGREISDKDPSYCKAFSDKFYIEQHLRASGLEYTILRPTWFADNAHWGFPGKLCMAGWRDHMGGKKLQVTVAKDIGRWAAEGLLQPDKREIRNQAVSIASDELTFGQIDEIFKRHTGAGVPVANWLLVKFVIWSTKDLTTMFDFIKEREYGADMKWLRSQLRPTSFQEFVESEVPRQ